MKKLFLLTIIIGVLIILSNCSVTNIPTVVTPTTSSARVMVVNEYDGIEDYTAIYKNDSYYVPSGWDSFVYIYIEWSGSDSNHVTIDIWDGTRFVYEQNFDLNDGDEAMIWIVDGYHP